MEERKPKVIKVPFNETRLDDREIAQEYVDMMNGISYACYKHDEFSPGHRNTLVVNITVGSYKLGLIPIGVLNEFIDAGLIDPSSDDEDTYERLERVMKYEETFTWNWMLDPDEYLGYCHDLVYDQSELPLSFELV